MNQFTLQNTIHEVLTQTGPELSLFFPEGMLQFIPENYRDMPMCEVAQRLMMPWGAPFMADDLVREANEVVCAESGQVWDLIPLWVDHLTIETNNWNSVCLMRLKSQLEGVRPAVIICPGGGYEFVSFDYEGLQIARRMEAEGYRAFILNYRFSPNRYPAPQIDLALAIKYLRANAKQYQIDPSDLMIMGFSAGGHLCASTAALPDKIGGYLTDALTSYRPEWVSACADISARPDKICLCYPVISFLEDAHEPSVQALTGGEESLRQKLSVETLVTANYPKTFIWTCLDDAMVPPNNAVRMGEALKRENAPCELKLYPQGGHGCALATGTSAAGWVDTMLNYMKE